MTPTEFECCADQIRYQFEQVEQAARLVLVHGKTVEEAARTYGVQADDVGHVVRSYLEVDQCSKESIITMRIAVHDPCLSLELAA